MKVYHKGKSYGGTINVVEKTQANVIVNGNKLTNPEFVFTSVYDNGEEISQIPFNINRPKSAVLNGDIYVVAGTSTVSNAFYKWDGMEWIYMGELPYISENSSLIAYNNELHLLGGSSTGCGTKHYKWTQANGWQTVSTIPYTYSQGSVVVFNNAIHLLGGVSPATTNHYKWTQANGWQSVSTIPYNFFHGAAVVYGDTIHIMGGINSLTTHSKLNGTTWETVETLPGQFPQKPAIVYKGKIYMFGLTSAISCHTWNGTTLTELTNANAVRVSNTSVVIYDKKINIIAGVYAPTDEYALQYQIGTGKSLGYSVIAREATE